MATPTSILAAAIKQAFVDQIGRTDAQPVPVDDVATKMAVAIIAAIGSGTGQAGLLAQQVFPFTNSLSVPVDHNLALFPSVAVFDQDGDEIECEINHETLNRVVVNFATATSGKVVINYSII